jgi:fatty acyl-CoA reductase
MNKSILLIGCTGFLGKCILYKILKGSELNICLIVRNKNGISYKNRIPIILQEINCKEEKYIQRIKPINVNYIRNQKMKIKFSDEDKTYILQNINYVINCLADINFNRPLLNAVQNNTLTALNWLNICKQSTNKIKYIYISTAYVNYHLDEEIIQEKIYEKKMDKNTLTNVLNKKITSIKPYLNTYTYSKQLTEIILSKEKKSVDLYIIRPSIIVPAHKYPYKGYGALQTSNILFFGVITGTLAYVNLEKNKKTNCIIPVDKVANMCLHKLKSKKKYSINHCSYNNTFWGTSKVYECSEHIYNNYQSQPILIKSNYYKPYIPMFIGDSTFYKLYSVIYFIIIKLIQGMSIFDIYKSLNFTYKYSYVTHFLKKNKQFIMKKPLKEIDISHSILHYIDHHLENNIKLNSLFL